MAREFKITKINGETESSPITITMLRTTIKVLKERCEASRNNSWSAPIITLLLEHLFVGKNLEEISSIVLDINVGRDIQLEN